jgi:DNA repair exonuclease SbcCD nuclease subunit
VKTIIHCADLHLCAAPEEREYCLAVLDEIADLARRERAAALLFCGDLFDGFRDLEALRIEFRRRIEALPAGCAVVYIVGNHEPHGAGGQRAGAFDLGGIAVVEDGPFELLVRDGVELLCVPHQPSYSGYTDWKVPPKKTKLRLGLAHGLVTGMDVYAGPDDEESGECAGALDPDLFGRFEVDYAALGHIHARREKTIGACRLCYPGSARVWRKGEDGERGVYVLSCDDRVQGRFEPLASAGQYRVHDLPLGLDGGLDGVEECAASWGARDWIHLRLGGVVDDENAVAEVERRLRREWAGRVRRLDVSRDGVEVLEGIARHALARKFLAVWERGFAAAGPADRSLWLRARQLGLMQMRTIAGRSA